MIDPSELPRPVTPRQAGERVGAWLAWFGPGRLVLAAASVVVVVAGAYWLLRAPTPPTEASLPVAVAATTTASAPATPAAAATTTVPAAGPVVVHVAGAVAQPGVYELDAGARVHDAIGAAGGAVADAELDGLNLAATVADGERIYVPAVGEVDPAAVPAATPAAGEAAPPGPLDLNEATAEQLEALPGVGPATAAAIVEDRTRNGPFGTVDDLDRVPGIGPAKLANLRDRVTV